jgi:hypothetical protein
MKSKNKRIVRYKKPININIGVIILTLIFLYLGINCVIYLSRDKISIYEVVKGESEVVKSISTTGIALRNEVVTNSPTSGHINFYVKEGNRVSVGNTLYTIDENGDFSEMLETLAENDATLTQDNLTEIKNSITKFIITYDSDDFDSVYDFKYNLDATLLENINLNSLEAIDISLSENGGTTLSLNRADRAGIVEFYTDGFENVTPESVTSEMFDKSNYTKSTVSSGTNVAVDTPIYKTIENEDWQIIIQLTDEQATTYADIDVVSVYFPTEDITTSAYFSIINNDNSYFGVLDLKRYMMHFADDRFIDIKIIGASVDGLKVPKTSITKKDFYIVPVAYLTTGGDSEDTGFQRDILSNGEALVEFVPVDVICTKDDMCYIDTNAELSKGDVLVMPNSSERYTVEGTAELNGVYNVNTGYTTFRYVDILSEKNGYYFVTSGSTYGLQVYDQIVLNASLVKENQVIFK